MQHIEELKNKAKNWKDQLTKTPLERALSEATSNENWNTPTKISQEIADATYSYTDCNTVMKYIWKCLNSDNKDWRRVLKTIALIEYLIKNGAPRCIGEFKDEIFKIRTFNDFYILESGADRGASSNYYLLVKVREKTKTVLDLLANEKQIEEERENAKKIKERLNANGGSQAMGSDSSYQAYGSSSQSTSTTKQVDNDYSRKYGVYNQDSSSQSQGGLDKYRNQKEKDAQQEQSQKSKTNDILKEDISPVQLKKPFQEPAKKLTKPGEEWSVPVQQSTNDWNTPGPAVPIQKVQISSASLIDFEEPIPVKSQPKLEYLDTQWSSFPSNQPVQQQNQPPVQQQPTQQVFQTQQVQPLYQPQPVQQIQQPQQQFLYQMPNLTSPQPQQQVVSQQQQNILQGLQFPNYQQQPQAQFQPQAQTQFQPNYQQQQPQQFDQQQQLPQQAQQQPQLAQQQQNLTSLYQNPQQSQYNQSQPQQVNSQINYTPQYTQQQQVYPNQQQSKQNQFSSSPQKDEFQDFQSSNQNQAKAFQSIDDKLLNLSDLTKDIKNDQKKQQQSQQQTSQSYNQSSTQLYTSQSEMDTFQINYNQPPQQQQQQQYGLGQNYNNTGYGQQQPQLQMQQQGLYGQQTNINQIPYQQQMNQQYGQQILKQ